MEEKCPLQPTMGGIEGKVDTLIELHRYVIRWLVICVCTMAIGTKAVDSIRGFFGGVTPAVAEDSK